jgi:hypothetical protein
MREKLKKQWRQQNPLWASLHGFSRYHYPIMSHSSGSGGSRQLTRALCDKETRTIPRYRGSICDCHIFMFFRNKMLSARYSARIREVECRESTSALLFEEVVLWRATWEILAWLNYYCDTSRAFFFSWPSYFMLVATARFHESIHLFRRLPIKSFIEPDRWWYNYTGCSL